MKVVVLLWGKLEELLKCCALSLPFTGLNVKSRRSRESFGLSPGTCSSNIKRFSHPPGKTEPLRTRRSAQVVPPLKSFPTELLSNTERKAIWAFEILFNLLFFVNFSLKLIERRTFLSLERARGRWLLSSARTRRGRSPSSVLRETETALMDTDHTEQPWTRRRSRGSGGRWMRSWSGPRMSANGWRFKTLTCTMPSSAKC